MSVSFPVRRRVRLTGPDLDRRGRIVAADIIEQVPGCWAGYEPQSHHLVLNYDRAEVGFAELEPLLIAHQVWPPTSWLGRLRRSWILYTEANLREQVHSRPSPCCSEGARRPHAS